MWDVAARYSGEFNGFKLAVAAAYTTSAWTLQRQLLSTAPDCRLELRLGGTSSLSLARWADATYFQAGTYLEHVPTGLWGYVAYGHFDQDRFIRCTNLPDQDTWYFKAGLRERWHPLGHTVLYGEYETGADCRTVDVDWLDFRLWGLGVVQEIDAAAMSLWLSYRHIEADDHVAAVRPGCRSAPAGCRGLPVREGWRSDQLLIA